KSPQLKSAIICQERLVSSWPVPPNRSGLKSTGRLLYCLWWAPWCLRGDPGVIQNLFLQGLIDVWFDQILKRISRLIVFPPAASRPFLWQVALVHDISEHCGVGAVSETDEVKEALRWCAVHVGKSS